MGRTLIDGLDQIQGGTISRADLCTATSGSAVIAKIIAGAGLSISSTGADAGTGDVTISLSSVSTALLSGTLAAAQAPAYSGDMTTSAGSLTTTVSKIGGKAVSLGGALTTSGAFSLTLTTTAATTLTLPTSGTVTALGNTTTGSGSIVRATGPTLSAPVLGTPASGTLTNCSGLPIAGLTGLGAGVAAALGASAVGSGAIVLASAVSSIVGGVASVAALRLLSTAWVWPFAVTKSYYAGAPGGGGVYIYNATDTASADNGGTIIVDAASRRWYLQNEGAISIRCFGAQADVKFVTGACTIAASSTALTVTGAQFSSADVGKTIVVPGAGVSSATLVTTISAVTSTTQITLAAAASTALSGASQTVTYGTDNAAAINAAISAAMLTGNVVLIPAGNYYLGSALSLTYSAPALGAPLCTIRGEGHRASYLWFGPGAYNGLTINGTTLQESLVRLEDFALIKTDNQGIGLYLLDIAHGHISDLYIQGWADGVYGYDVQQTSFYNVLSMFNLRGGTFMRNTWTFPNSLLFQDCEFSSNYFYGIDFHDPAVVKYLGGGIEFNGQGGGNTGSSGSTWGARVLIDSSSTEGTMAASFDGVDFENNGSTTAGVGIADLIYNNSAADGMLSVNDCDFHRVSYWCTNNISITTTGGFRHKIRIRAGFKGFTTLGYTPSSARLYWQIYNTGGDLIEVDDTGSYYCSAVENPAAQYNNAISMRCAQSSLGGFIRFNGATGVINASFGVASLTRNSAGDYTVTLGHSQPNPGTRAYGVTLNSPGLGYLYAETSTTFEIRSMNVSGVQADFTIIMVTWSADPTA